MRGSGGASQYMASASVLDSRFLPFGFLRWLQWWAVISKYKRKYILSSITFDHSVLSHPWKPQLRHITDEWDHCGVGVRGNNEIITFDYWSSDFSNRKKTIMINQKKREMNLRRMSWAVPLLWRCRCPRIHRSRTHRSGCRREGGIA